MDGHLDCSILIRNALVTQNILIKHKRPKNYRKMSRRPFTVESLILPDKALMADRKQLTDLFQARFGRVHEYQSASGSNFRHQMFPLVFNEWNQPIDPALCGFCHPLYPAPYPGMCGSPNEFHPERFPHLSPVDTRPDFGIQFYPSKDMDAGKAHPGAATAAAIAAAAAVQSCLASSIFDRHHQSETGSRDENIDDVITPSGRIGRNSKTKIPDPKNQIPPSNRIQNETIFNNLSNPIPIQLMNAKKSGEPARIAYRCELIMYPGMHV